MEQETSTHRNLTLIVIALVILLAVSLYFTFQLTGFAVGNEEEILIGAPLALTGKLASFGIDIKNGIDLAVEKVNKEKSFKLKVVYEDTQTDPTLALTAVQNLINLRGVHVLIGPLSSSELLAALPITESKKIVEFNPIASTSDAKGEYFFRNREKVSAHGIKMAEFFVQKNIGGIAVLSASSANSKAYKDPFLSRLKELGIEPVFSEDYDPAQRDFKTEILKAISQGAESFYLSVSSGVDGGIIVKQIRKSGFKGVIATSTAAESTEFLDTAEEYAEGVIFTSPFFDVNNPEVKAYADEYQTRFGKVSSPFAANAYDAVQLIANAISECNSDNSDCIRDYLYNVENYAGMGGKTTFDATGNVIKPVMLKTISNGEFVKLESA